ncbi:MAG: CDP-archaeol synthase [Bacteroidales bacterium]|nr:CDP-archaeol synthase [Bacteroidales bacterium]
MNTFWKRTISATVYALLFLGSIYSGRFVGEQWGTIILTAFALFVALGCTFEYFRIAEKQGAHPIKPLGYVWAALMVIAGAAPAGLAWVISVMVLVLVSMVVTLCVQLWRNTEQPFADVLHTLLPMYYAALPLSLMAILHNGLNVLVMCIIMVWVNDSFAYMGGSLIGRHKMWPRHSPGKTWEGTAVGVAAAVATGLLVGPLFQTSLQWYDWLVLSLVCSIVGTLGDLTESMLKRSVGLKDSGNIMPGHGGFLDRFDSLLFILPVVYVYCFIAIF